ncbi:MAG: hypothetical protein JWP29_5297 [Rhodoferax sp.]|nr:hypothetical protein [Rhodoferax sp.]
MRSPSAEAMAPATFRWKKLGLSFVFFLGGMAHELRNPIQCQCVTARAVAIWRAPQRKRR